MLSLEAFMQYIRKVVDRISITSVCVPEEFGDKVEIIVIPVTDCGDDVDVMTALHAAQADTEFFRQILADEKEDVWNDI